MAEVNLFDKSTIPDDLLHPVLPMSFPGEEMIYFISFNNKEKEKQRDIVLTLCEENAKVAEAIGYLFEIHSIAIDSLLYRMICNTDPESEPLKKYNMYNFYGWRDPEIPFEIFNALLQTIVSKAAKRLGMVAKIHYVHLPDCIQLGYEE